MKTAFLLATALFFLTGLVGCETSRGFGKDVEQSGKNIQETIEKND